MRSPTIAVLVLTLLIMFNRIRVPESTLNSLGGVAGWFSGSRCFSPVSGGGGAWVGVSSALGGKGAAVPSVGAGVGGLGCCASCALKSERQDKPAEKTMTAPAKRFGIRVRSPYSINAYRPSGVAAKFVSTGSTQRLPPSPWFGQVLSSPCERPY